MLCQGLVVFFGIIMKPYLTGEVFGKLLDLGKFIQYGLTGYTIERANGAGLAPEFLHDIGRVA